MLKLVFGANHLFFGLKSPESVNKWKFEECFIFRNTLTVYVYTSFVCIYQHFIDIICREVSMSMMLHSYFFSHFDVVSFRRIFLPLAHAFVISIENLSISVARLFWINSIKTTLVW